MARQRRFKSTTDHHGPSQTAGGRPWWSVVSRKTAPAARC